MRIFAFIFPTLFLASCFSDPEPLNISVVSDEFIPGIIHDITYRYNGEIIENPEVVFDSVAGIYRSRLDTTKVGEYSVTLTTVFDTETTQTFHVNSDSTLSVRNNLPFKRVGFLSEDSMLKADTVQFVRVVKGSTERDLHKITLVKNGSGYDLTEFPQRSWCRSDIRMISPEEGAMLIREFVASENEIERLRYTNAGEEITSTNRQYVFFRADSEVYSYYDDASEWVSYPQVYIP